MPKKTTQKQAGAQKKTGASSKAKTAGSAKRNRKQRVPSSASYVTAAVFAVLGLLLGIGYFSANAIAIAPLCSFFKGIIGIGYYLLPPIMLYSAAVLAFSKKKAAPVKAASLMVLPVLIGCTYQLICGVSFDAQASVISTLWANGIICRGGGVIAGGTAVIFSRLFSIIGAWIITVLLIIADCFLAFSIPLAVVTKKPTTKKQQRERAEYYKDMKEELVYGSPEKKERIEAEREREKQKSQLHSTVSISSRIDIPIDEDMLSDAPVAPKPKSEFFNKKSDVKTPADYLTKKQQPFTERDIDAVVNSEPISGFEEVKVDTPVAPQKETETSPKAKIPITVIDTEPVHKSEPIKPEPEKQDIISDIENEIKEGEAEEKAEEYIFPPLDLLARPTMGNVDSDDEVYGNTVRLENALKSFGINAEISNVVHGPSVTRYEMELEVGVKLNKLTNLADDIALALGATGVRIAAIPNKISTVGIEVPNKNINTVYLREIIDSSAFHDSASKISFAIGKNISGEAIVGNIAKLPHLLVAGTTGSGKSVCLNSLILSILYKATPDEVKFIMVDPKMVEFKVYNGIPHLKIPVVTEAKKASGALQWAVNEMMRRYRLFSETGARDLASYNAIAEKNEETDKIEQIVIIIDELADLMLVAAKEVEESICRIAQMGRAAGMHLVIATQSPRADVITGLMKANIPSRISFKVASSLESRIILDAGGNADKLVGNGDMLYAPIGVSKPYRIQGTWVTDDEREQIVDFVKQHSKPDFEESNRINAEIDTLSMDKKAQAQAQASASGEQQSDVDEMFPQAVEIVLEAGQASVSMLQRRLKLGYSRAARLVDQMEDKGIVGPFEGSKPRQVLITKEQWQEMQYIQATAPVQPAQPVMEPGQTMSSAEDLFND